MNCYKCKARMAKISRRNEMEELDEDATDGQMTDFNAVELSGDYGDWNLGIVEYECPNCSSHVELISDELANFNGLILGWHEKATEGDSFSRIVFEYLAFIAHLKNNIFDNIPKDRYAIQALKRTHWIKQRYLKHIKSCPEHLEHWHAVIEALNSMPLKNSSRDYDNPEIDKWWNSQDDTPLENNNLSKGVIHSIED